MGKQEKKLTLSHIDLKIKSMSSLKQVVPPANGWLYAVRTALNITLAQVGKRMGMSAQQIKDFETRERTGSITIKSLREIASSLDLELVYAIVPKQESLAQIVAEKASAKAAEIVNRTSRTMTLENQENSAERLQQAVQEKTRELTDEMPHLLWD